MAEPTNRTRSGSLLRNIAAKTTRFIKGISTEQLFLIGAVIVLAMLAFGSLMTALNNALFFDGYAEDGAFQLLNPLRRMAEGQVIGRDFNFFHGIGTPLLHFPAYMLFGQGIFGDEMARWLVSPVLFGLSSFCFFYILRRSLAFALSMTGLVTVIALLIMPFMVLPITSILGVRSMVPVLLMAVMLKQRRLQRPTYAKGHRLVRGWTWYEIVVGALLALAIVCGTEFGVAAVLGFGIVHLAYRSRDGQSLRERAWSGLRIVLGLGVALFVLLTVLTLGHPLQPLKYAFLDIPVDQVWYFGVPPNQFIHQGNVFSTIWNDKFTMTLLFVVLLAVVLIWRLHRSRQHRVEVQAFMFGWLSGLFGIVSALGYYYYTQFGALTRMSLLICVAIAYIWLAAQKRPLNFGIEIGAFKKRIRVSMATVWRSVAVLAIVASVMCAVQIFGLVKDTYDIMKTLRAAVGYVTGAQTNVLAARWRNISEQIIPIVQANNYVPIVDHNQSGFTHGIDTDKRQVVVRAGDKASFLQHGKAVYLKKAGRQLIAHTEKQGDNTIVTLQPDPDKFRLDPAVDGTFGKMIVAEDFKHDDTKLWSFYTGALNQEMGLVHPSSEGYDYIIHALGKQRRAEYVDDLARIQPQYITTFMQPYSGWEGWMQNTHWELYSLIDKNYEVVQETTIYALWKRKDQPWTNDRYAGATWQKLEVTADGKVKLPVPSFENIPNVEEYGRQLVQHERERREMMGRAVDKRPQLGQEAYDDYRLQRIREERQWEVFKLESNGRETEKRLTERDKQRANQDSDSTPSLHLPRPNRQVVMVKLKYELSYSPKLPLLDKSARYLLQMNNVYSDTDASLRPYGNEVVIPVVISELNKDPYLQTKTYSLFPGSGSIKILDAQWATLDTSVANLKTLTD